MCTINEIREYVLIYTNIAPDRSVGYLNNNNVLTVNGDEAKVFNTRQEALIYREENRKVLGSGFQPFWKKHIEKLTETIIEKRTEYSTNLKACNNCCGTGNLSMISEDVCVYCGGAGVC